MTELDIKRRASELLQKGRYDEAVAEYEALLDGSKKHNPAIHNLIGDIYVKQGNFEKGFQHYLSAAKAYKEEGLFHNGIAVGKKILRLDRDQTDVYGMLADLYARQGLGMDSLKFLREFARRKEEGDQYPAALAAYAETCQILADVPDVHIAYGEMLERVDRLDDAAACYTNAAQAYSDKGWNDQAEQLTRRAKGLNAGAAGAPEASTTSVSDLMSLRSLDDPPAKPAAPAEPAAPAPVASDDPATFTGPGHEPLDLDAVADAPAPAMPATPPAPPADETPWKEYQGDDASLPPPPPLPPRAVPVEPPAAAPTAADPSDLFVEPAGLDGDEPAVPELTLDASGVGSLQDALDEMASLDAAADAPAPATPAEPGGLVLDGVDAAAPAPAPPATKDEPAEAESVDLADLPGIILPGQAADPPAPAAPEAPPATPAPDLQTSSAAIPAPTLPPAPADPVPPSLATSSAAIPAPTLPPTPEPPADVAPPAPPAPPAAPPEAPAGAPAAEGGDADLHEFFEATAAESSEHTVVIGDDFELLREGGDVNEVIADFRDATMEILDLEDYQAHYDLGTTYMEMELFDEAAAEFELSARGDEHALASQEMLGYCFLRKGQIDIAIKELHKGLAIEGYDEQAKLGLLYNLGIACGVLDQEQEAIAHFQKILQIDPEFRDTRSRLERLVQSSA